MEEWEIRLKHERDIRDCHVEAGNIKIPTQPDPDGCLITYTVRQFNGPAFQAAMALRQHTAALYQDCKAASCRQGLKGANNVSDYQEFVSEEAALEAKRAADTLAQELKEESHEQCLREMAWPRCRFLARA